MMISIGADHRGFALKQAIKDHFRTMSWIDVGTHDEQRTDYPLYATRVTKNILDGVTPFGILICGSGVGIAMAANRNKKIRAAVCWNADVALCAKEHDDVNVLVLPADFVSPELSIAIIDAWLKAGFKGGRYQERLDMIDEK